MVCKYIVSRPVMIKAFMQNAFVITGRFDYNNRNYLAPL